MAKTILEGRFDPNADRWATPAEQQENTSKITKLIEFRGERKPAAAWARIVGMNVDVIKRRVFKLGWSIESALTIPPKKTRPASKRQRSSTERAPVSPD